MTDKPDKKPVRLLSEAEAAEILHGAGAKNATARTLRFLLQKPGAPARGDFQVDLAAVATYLRELTGREAPGLRGVAQLFDEIVPRGSRPRALTYAERQAKSRAKSHHNDIGGDFDRAWEGINWKMRHRAETDFAYFLKVYCTNEDPTCGAFLEIAPPPGLIPIAWDMQQAIADASIPYHIREARGHGKTAFSKGGCLWVGSTGRRHYVVAVAANDENASGIIDNIFDNMTKNPAFVRDWPELSIPFLKLEGAYQRAKTQTCHGHPTNIKRSDGKIVLPTINDPRTGRPFPSSGVILEAIGFNAGARGKSKGILRPDLILFDDLQNDEKAQSEGMVGKMVKKIKKTFMGLAGHRKKIAAIMTSTPIEADDLSETFAADPGWKTKTYKMMPTYPRCHDITASPEDRKGVRDYWEEYWDLFTAEKNADRIPHIAANRFYRKHRKEMDEGASVLNQRNFDPDTEVSGIQHAMNILFRDGLETFLSEYQMEPPKQAAAVQISARLIMSRVRSGVPANTPPAGTVYTAAATDINPGYGITTSVTAFDFQLTGLVTSYHVKRVRIPDKLNDVEFNRQVFEALAETGREIAALGAKIDDWGIDAGGRQFDVVTKFAAQSRALCGIQATAMLGRAGQNWNPNVRSRIRSSRNDTVLCQDTQRRRWLAWNADSYKEKMHRAWGTEVGAPGGLSLFDGGVNHSKFAAQIANERLVSKTKIKGKGDKETWSYKWKTKEPHDYGDTEAMCYALAGSQGLTGDGGEVRTAPKCCIGSARKTAPAVSKTETTTQQPFNPRPKCCIGHR